MDDKRLEDMSIEEQFAELERRGELDRVGQWQGRQEEE